MKKVFFIITSLLALFTAANAAEGDYIIKYREDAPVVMTYSDTGSSLGAGMYLVPAEQALALKEAGYLEICDKNIEMTYYDTATDDEYYANQWNLPMIKAPYAWSFKTYGNDVLVGVIDSGLAPNHPDIDYSRVEKGYNFGALQTDEDYETNRLDTTDTNGHGTMVAGTIVAKRNNSVGIAGIADKVKLLPMKVENKLGSIYLNSVIAAINAGAGCGCDVINISLGVDSPYDSLDAAIKNATDQGCIVICAAGNDTTQTPGDHIRYPAGCDGAISVGSMTQSYTRAESSVVNESIFICAPASGILLLGRYENYETSGGTSFAAPQVAAAAAIAKSINPSLTPAEFAEILKNTAYRPGVTQPYAPTRDTEIGYGLLDIEAMIKYMSGDAALYVSPFDSDTSSVTIFNLTDREVAANSFFSLYNSKGQMVAFCPANNNVKIEANGYLVRTFSLSYTSGRLRHFIWNSLENAFPHANSYTRELIK